jgi:hypothetical protein
MRRAIVDSLPLLRKAKDITVVEMIEDDSSNEEAVKALKRVGDVITWLSRNRIMASPLVPEKCYERSAAAALDGVASTMAIPGCASGFWVA